MTKKHVYEQPKTTVHQLEEICGLLAASGSGKTATTDGNKGTNGYEESNPDKVDAKKNGNLWGNGLWDN